MVNPAGLLVALFSFFAQPFLQFTTLCIGGFLVMSTLSQFGHKSRLVAHSAKTAQCTFDSFIVAYVCF